MAWCWHLVVLVSCVYGGWRFGCSYVVFYVEVWRACYSCRRTLLGLLLPVAASGPGAQVSKRIDKAVVPLVTLGIVPLFAFVSTGVSFDMSQD